MKLVYNYRKKTDHLFLKWFNMRIFFCFGDSDWFIIRVNGLTIISLARFSNLLEILS